MLHLQQMHGGETGADSLVCVLAEVPVTLHLCSSDATHRVDVLVEGESMKLGDRIRLAKRLTDTLLDAHLIDVAQFETAAPFTLARSGNLPYLSGGEPFAQALAERHFGRSEVRRVPAVPIEGQIGLPAQRVEWTYREARRRALHGLAGKP